MNPKNQTRRTFLKNVMLQSAVLLTVSSMRTFAAKTQLPNFIFILSDDQGWNGTSVQMHKDRMDSKSDYHFTSNLERLASEGMIFSEGYSPAALCCPTRRSIQFGQMPARQGNDARFVENYSRGNQNLTIPRMLKSVNSKYKAAHFGKWDLRTNLIPEDIGYDISDGNTRNSVGNEGSDFGKEGKWKYYKELDDPKRIFSITERATQFMEKQVNNGNPFYLQISHYATHVDMQTRPETFAKYMKKQKGSLHKIPAFAAMTEDLDTGVGIVLDKIESLGIKDNTYVFYMADNGAVPWIPPDRKKHEANPLDMKEDPSRNYPLRAGKWMIYEGGTRVPFLAKGPGVKAGVYSDIPVIGWDLLPTIADLAGYNQSLPDYIDGGSFKTVLEGQSNASVLRPFNGFVFHRYSNGYPHTSILYGDYKFVKFWKSGEKYLFNLESNLEETKNLIKELPYKAEQLEKLLMDYLKSVNSDILKLYG